MSDDHAPNAPGVEHGCTDPNEQITKEAIGSLLVPAGITPSPDATVEELTAMVDDAQKSGLIPETASAVAPIETAEKPHRIAVEARSNDQELSMADTVELIKKDPASP